MARPQKSGLDYFPLDVQMDDNVSIIEAEHGLIGFGVLIKLYQKIYSEGYYYPWTEKEQLLFSKSISVDRNVVASVVSDCIKWGIFHPKLYEKYNILTSRGIQSRYVAAVYKRTSIEMVEEYLLINVSDRENIIVTRVSDIRNSDATDVSDVRCTQSKVEKSKEKESSSGNSKSTNTPPPLPVDLNLQRLEKAYISAAFGTVGPIQADFLVELAEEYTPEWVEMAIQKAAFLNKKNLGYVKGILQGWRADGGPNMDLKKSHDNKPPPQKYKYYDSG